MKFSSSVFACCTFFLSTVLVASAQTSAQNRWIPYGPGGGDARAFASDPADHNHIFLGTALGIVYDSHDGGKTWKRLSQVDKRDDLALDNIYVDPKDSNHLVLGAWVLGQKDGGVYISHDAGKTWTVNPQMAGHSIRALTSAPSDPKVLVLGALDGIFRSTDGGDTWNRITPEGSTELHEVESIAIDPKDPQTIYAGTWHLPWKTTDGGANWANMKEGIIDDSDVFSIIVDPVNEQNIYLSACSGIYRSTDKGSNFTKVKGIPSTARRTRVLMEDPKHPGTVFAGTTEGIWRSTDAGQAFQRNADPALIVNDVNIDPTDSNRVLLATDRTGVMLSNDGGVTFTPANAGFSTRQITAVVQDPKNKSQVYVGVLNDKTAGGVFGSSDGGEHWAQMSQGLNGADIFSLGSATDGTVLAGTRHGIYRLEGTTWKQSGMTNALPPLPEPDTKTVTVKLKNGKTATRTVAVKKKLVRKVPPVQFAGRIYSLAALDKSVFAASDEGVLVSNDDGRTWNRIRTADKIPVRAVAAMDARVIALDHGKILLSTDSGATFKSVANPTELPAAHSAAIDKTGRVWLGGPGGIFISQDDGTTWTRPKEFYVAGVNTLYYDAPENRLYVAATHPETVVYSIDTGSMKVSHVDSGWVLSQVRPLGGRLFGITPYEGVVLQPVGGDASLSVAGTK